MPSNRGLPQPTKEPARTGSRNVRCGRCDPDVPPRTEAAVHPSRRSQRDASEISPQHGQRRVPSPSTSSWVLPTRRVRMFRSVEAVIEPAAKKPDGGDCDPQAQALA